MKRGALHGFERKRECVHVDAQCGAFGKHAQLSEHVCEHAHTKTNCNKTKYGKQRSKNVNIDESLKSCPQKTYNKSHMCGYKYEKHYHTHTEIRGEIEQWQRVFERARKLAHV
jgi:hypothetical protein